MINWDVLIGAENSIEGGRSCPESGARPTALSVEYEKVGRPEANNHNGFKDSAPLAPLAPLKNKGVGLERENNPHVEGVASDNFRDAKTHSINPIAICMLLTCCNKVTASSEEILEQMMKLQTMTQSEQIRSWAMTCQKYGIDPYRIIYPFTESPNKGTSCQGCKHISMQKILTDKRPVFRFVCGQNHHMLEALYVGERVLVAPESCNDYQPTA
ncbi:hypothetical protein [Nitrosomonas supralitoralis]|uniref:Uncharacterized protein n=1 Tax=Nitrosomonas supralitoralis TaxID=2116706 RepID=A0A2P7NYK8_9PROT|nr:hypothetical protein [Nitrosomonas supralitoralis]PSJ18517.1 hypothetical protein C7H79_02740 [Nitrosomonas supralitoralis]